MKRDLKATIAIVWFFTFQGGIFGNYAAVIPTVQKAHHCSNGVLGGILVGCIAGAMLSLPLVVQFNEKFGSKYSSLFAVIAIASLNLIMGVSGSYWILLAGFIAFGFGMGWIDVCLNTQAVSIEKATKSHKLGLCHCFYGIGGLTGALIGGSLIEYGMNILLELAIVSCIYLLPCLFLYSWLYSNDEEKIFHSADETTTKNQPLDNESQLTTSLLSSDMETSTSSSSSSPSNPSTSSSSLDQQSMSIEFNQSSQTKTSLLLGFCLLGGLAYFGEGSIGDWSAIYLTHSLHASPLIASLGFVSFQICAILGRLSCDSLQRKFPRSYLLQGCGVCACLGLSLVVSSSSLSTNPSIILSFAILGFAICGSGLSMVAPIVISGAGAASSSLSMSPSESIAYVSSISYVGLMIGPPLIGGLSTVLGLRFALLVDALLLLSISPIGFFLVPRALFSYSNPQDSTNQHHNHHSKSHDDPLLHTTSTFSEETLHQYHDRITFEEDEQEEILTA